MAAAEFHTKETAHISFTGFLRPINLAQVLFFFFFHLFQLILKFFSRLSLATSSSVQNIIIQVLACGPVPQHVAIIMDGNRRFAVKSHMDRIKGHAAGYESLIRTLEMCIQLGVRYMTVYAFSIDNFNRSKDEVSHLMDLMQEKLDLILSNSVINDYGVQVRILGNLSLLPEKVRASAERAMAATKDNASAVFNICIAYTSTQEIVHAIDQVRKKHVLDWDSRPPMANGLNGKNIYNQISKNNGVVSYDQTNHRSENKEKRFNSQLAHFDEVNHQQNMGKSMASIDMITEEAISRELYTAGCPPIDLLIRTSGETRLSNFMLWQCSDSHLAFSRALWPEFSFWHLFWIIVEYQRAYSSLIKHRRLRDEILYRSQDSHCKL